MNKDNQPSNIAEKHTHFILSKIFFAILSGIMLTAAFPPGRLSFLAWVALVPLFKSIDNESPSRAFRLGFVAGTVHYLSLIYWVVVVVGRYGNLNPFLSCGPLLLLCLYLALYPAFFSLLSTYLKSFRFVVIFMASFWVGLEYLRAKLLTGFPWCLLGYTQYRHLNLIQVSDISGVYGLSFLIVLINGLIYCLFSGHYFKKNNGLLDRGLLKCEILLIGLMAVATLVYGHYRLQEGRIIKEPHKGVRSVIVQGNIDQSVKWDPKYQIQTIAIYQRLTRAAYDFRPELIVWPETAVPFFFQNNDDLSQKVASLAKECGAALVFGSPAYEQIAGMTKYYNRAYLITPDDKPWQYYDKIHLVPFGEYIPLKRILFFVDRLVTGVGDFEGGDEIITLKHRNLSIGVLICFEAIFPEISRAHVMKGANLLVNLTNDAWFGRTSAPYQHLSMAVFRAVENKRPMIRAANTGFSAFIGPQGKIIAMGSLFNEETLKGTLDIPEKPLLTFYTRFGDVFALCLLVISLLKIFFCVRRKRIAKR